MSKIKFAANLSTLFPDIGNFVERFDKAKEMGFQFVEAQFLYEYDLTRLAEAKKETNLELVLLNAPFKGSVHFTDAPVFGVACLPGLEYDFIKMLHQAISYATSLRCERIHIIAGIKPETNFHLEDLESTYVRNLQVAAEMLEEHNIIGLIEPMCSQVKKNYFLDSFETALHFIKLINSNHLKLLLDVYHFHMLGGKVETDLEKYLPYAGHIQVSQAPGRNEPFGEGEINYKEVFNIIEKSDYNGYIGLEYIPSGEGFKWLREYGFKV